MFFSSVFLCILEFLLSLPVESFLLLGSAWDTGRGQGEPSQTNALLSLSSHLDSTKKVSDVLKLFEDGEMAKYLQEDVSGSSEIFS